VIDRPLPGLGHALAWPAGGGPAPPLRLSRARGLGATLRAARQAHGLSLRQAAAALGVRSHVTVRNAERGVDVAHSTLRAYLAAFPELAPEDLLPRPARREQLGADALWEHLRDVFGLHAREIEKRVRIDQDGRVRVSVRTSDLRDLRPGAPDVKLRHGGLPGVLQASPHVIDRITGAPAALRLRRTADRDGVAHEILRFQREPAGGGLSFTVRHARTVQPLFRLVPAAVGPEWGPGPHQEGTSHRVRFPCDRLRLVVTFPPGVRPPRVFGHSGPGCLVPDPEVPRLSAALPVPRAVLRERGAVVTASVTVARPVIGFSYGLGWQVC
jgi:transcriptional regulator with XRE-family HTH domain